MEFRNRLRRVRRSEPPEENGPGPVREPQRQLRPFLWNRIVGLSLLPFVWIFGKALCDTLTHAHLPASQQGGSLWFSYDFLMFAAGGLLWLLLFFAGLKFWNVPPLLRAYVFGHELMHTLMARLSRGRIREYRISSEGGYIVTDKYNFIIALAPYLWPFYSVAVLALWATSYFWEDPLQYREWFLGALGFTWMFHFTFTVWILPHGQTDFHGPGRIFSYLFIIIANTIFLSGALILLAPDVTWHDYGSALKKDSLEFYSAAGRALAWLFHYVTGIVRDVAG